MSPSDVRRIDPFAVLSATVAAVMAGVYVGVMKEQGSHPTWWVLAILGAGATLAAYGAVRTAPRRRWTLAVAGCLLVALGLLAIFSIGLPIALAGALALTALLRGPDGQEQRGLGNTR